MLKFFGAEARLPQGPEELPEAAVSYVARQVDVPPEAFAAYDWGSRTINLVGPDHEHQEVTMLCLHLLQSALVHLNTLLVQRVLTEPVWAERLVEEDRRGLTRCSGPTSTPTGNFQLDLDHHLDIGRMTTTAPPSTPSNRTPPRRKRSVSSPSTSAPQRPDSIYLKAVFLALPTSSASTSPAKGNVSPTFLVTTRSAAITKSSGTPGGPATPSWSRPCSTPGCASLSWSHPYRRRRPRRLPHPGHPRQGRQGPGRALPPAFPGGSGPARRPHAQARRHLFVRVQLEKTVLNPRGAGHAGPLRPESGPRTTWPPTVSATSSSPGSKLKASTTPLSSPIAATPAASPLRSTAVFHWRRPGNVRRDDQTVPRVKASRYFAPEDTLRSGGPLSVVFHISVAQLFICSITVVAGGEARSFTTLPSARNTTLSVYEAPCGS